VLSLPALRRLHFPDDKNRSTPTRDHAAQTVLAALALVAITQQQKQGYFLRSRCDLIRADDNAAFEMVTTATNIARFRLTAEEAVQLFQQAVATAKEANLPWPEVEIILTPKPALVQLVQRSRELAADEDGED
jgi:CRISPR-associated protein Csb1